MIQICMTKARRNLNDIVNLVISTGQRICIKKNNKPAMAIVPIEDIEMIEAMEDKIDVEEALKELKKGKFISLNTLKKKLGIK
jgi:prevent-host-death family protein